MKTNNAEIIHAALEVFSAKGYEAANLRDIAALLGITKPALYKHFENKEAIWNAMVDAIESEYSAGIGKGLAPHYPENADELKALTMSQFSFTTENPDVSRMRRLLMQEQYRDERMSAIATNHFINYMRDMYATVFEKLAEKGQIEKQDFSLLAFEYTAPITMLIHQYDREPQKKAEIMTLAEKHIDRFTEVFFTRNQ